MQPFVLSAWSLGDYYLRHEVNAWRVQPSLLKPEDSVTKARTDSCLAAACAALLAIVSRLRRERMKLIPVELRVYGCSPARCSLETTSPSGLLLNCVYAQSSSACCSLKTTSTELRVRAVHLCVL